MRKIFSRVLLVLATTACGLSAAAYAQLPVTDAASLEQLVLQVQTLQQELSQLQSLYSQAQQQYAAITGARGMDAVAPALSSLRTAVPDDYANNMVLPSALSAFGDIANGAAAIVRQSLQITTYPGNTFYQDEVTRQGDRMAAELAGAQAIYNTAVQRRQSLDLLRQQLASTTDEASVLQLNARVASETSQGINDLNQINAMMLMQTANRQADQQRLLEAESVARPVALNALNGQ